MGSFEQSYRKTKCVGFPPDTEDFYAFMRQTCFSHMPQTLLLSALCMSLAAYNPKKTMQVSRHKLPPAGDIVLVGARDIATS